MGQLDAAASPSTSGFGKVFKSPVCGEFYIEHILGH